MSESKPGLLLPVDASNDEPMFWKPSVTFLKFAIAFTLIGAIACLAALLALVPEQKLRIALALLWLPVGLLAWVSLARDRIRLTVGILCFGLWALVTTGLVVGGLSSTVLVVYPLIILIAGWMIGTRVTVVLAVLTIVTMLAVAVAESSGITLGFGGSTPPILRWVILSSVIAITAVLISYLVKAYRQRLKELRTIGGALGDRTAELQAREADLNRAQAVANIGSWVYDVRADMMHLSAETCRIFGLPEGTTGSRDAYLSRAHPEDRQAVDAAWNAAISKDVPFDFEHRIVVRKEIRWVRQKAELERDADGTLLRGVGVTQDITERKHIEDALRVSEARFRSLVALSSDWYWEQDADLRFVAQSGLRSELVGFSVAVLVGRHRWELPGLEIIGQTWDEHRSVLAARKPFRDLRLNRTDTDGSVHYLNVAGEPIFDASGQFTGYRGVASDVTERVGEGQRARAADERLRLAIEHLDESISIADADDRIVIGNRNFRELNRNTRPVESGHTYEEHLRAGLAVGNYPDAVGREEAWLAGRLARRRAGGSLEVRRQDGRWLQVTDQHLPDRSTITFSLDITERKAAEDRLRAALENLGEMITVTDEEDCIVLANRRFLEFNHPVAEFVTLGCHYSEHLRAGIALGMFPDAVGREEEWIAQRMAMRRRGAGPVERRRQDGRWLLVDDQVMPDGGIITFGLEITERKQAEEALRNINTELERRVAERTAQLEATYRELESFSYSVSHDLRAPLRAVTGFATILLKEEGEKVSAEGRRYLGIIDSNARRMAKLIDALLALGRYSRVELNRTEVDMERLAREACDELAPSWPAAQIVLGPLPPALGNATLLKQVFLNLVGNALKYSANAAVPRIEIRAQENRYIVSDNGAGFDMAFVGKLFQAFERLHTEREFEGTGIGLAIVKLIIERHGGRVEAAGTPGAGATFAFTLGGVV